jgi:multiple sugar transport system substrate-binding protein
MQPKRREVLAGAAAAAAVVAMPAVVRAQQPVEIEYWQYTFDSRVKAIDALIERFQAANPNIRVKHQHFPYAQYRARVATAIPAGEGPEVVQLFYGWLEDYIRANLLVPLPSDAFDPAVVDREFFPAVQAMKRGGQYYAMPTAVRSLALFWNKRLFREAGLDPERPPQTLDEYLEMARRTTKRDAQGNLTSAGATVAPDGQDHHWWREVLVRQFGGKPYSDDGRQVTYDEAGGVAAMQWYADQFKVHRIGEVGFMQEGQAAFRASRAAMTVDGSFRLAAFNGTRGLQFGIAELPSHNGVKSNFTSYWVNGISTKAAGAKLDAAKRFLAFITTPDAMALWLETVGELPARVDAAMTPANVQHPQFGPFIKGLEYAHATDFVQEDQQRALVIEAVDRVRLQDASAAQTVAVLAEAEQKLLDEFRRG